jgi:HEAT repeat protein
MNQLLEWLSQGDLRTDGMAPEVARLVVENPHLAEELLEGITSSDDVIRGHTADALERVSRAHPELVVERLDDLTSLAKEDPVPMVRWHLAMIFGNLLIYKDLKAVLKHTLLEMLEDESVFTISWVLSSLSILGRKYPQEKNDILQAIEPFLMDQSIAIRSRAKKAVGLLLDDQKAFPQGWIKSDFLMGI